MSSGHEVYPRAPLVLVTAQVTYAYEPRLNDPEIRDAFAEKVREVLPVLSVEQAVEGFDLASGEAQPRAVQRVQLRASNERRSASAVLSAQSLTVETTEYEHFEGFARLLSACFGALDRAVGSVRVARAGLRYIDEVRPPGAASTGDWTRWINPALAAPVSFTPGLSAVALTGMAVYQIGDRCAMNLRWGEQVGPSVVGSGALVRIEQPSDERFFVLDADAYWVPETPAPVKASELDGTFADLHTPISLVFENAVTDEARKLFRREKG